MRAASKRGAWDRDNDTPSRLFCCVALSCSPTALALAGQAMMRLIHPHVKPSHTPPQQHTLTYHVTAAPPGGMAQATTGMVDAPEGGGQQHHKGHEAEQVSHQMNRLVRCVGRLERQLRDACLSLR